MKEYKVELKLIMDYNGTSKNEVFKMINEEFGLGDKQFELDIDGESIYDYDDVNSEVENQEITGCGKLINPHMVCGDISFANKLILCEECGKDFVKSENTVKNRCKQALDRIESGDYISEEEFFTKSESSEGGEK